MKKIYVLCLFLITSVLVFAGEISFDSGGSLDITSRTSFGVNLDNPYQFGLKQELVDFRLRLNLTPYQNLSNMVRSPLAVGFIDITFFDFGIEMNPSFKPNAGGGGFNAPGNLTTNRFQTGEFVAGIARNNWIFQMNAGGNEPYLSPWNNGIKYVNDRVRFTWAFLQSMVDVRRVKKVSDLKPEDSVVDQFTQDGLGLSDTFGPEFSGATIAATYNKEEAYGFNIQFATQYDYTNVRSTEDNHNGIALGFDFALDPVLTKGFRLYSSLAGSYNYGVDSDPDPLYAGLQVAYILELNEDISIEPYLGADFGTALGAENFILEYETALGFTMRWPGQGGWYTDYILNRDGRVFPGMSLAYKMYGTTEQKIEDLAHNLKFTLFEPRGDEGLFYGIGSEIIIDLNNITNPQRELIATAYFDYTKIGIFDTAGSFIPWTTICYDNIPGSVSGRVNNIKLDLGVKLENVISNTVLGLSWHSGDLLHSASDSQIGIVKASVEIKY